MTPRKVNTMEEFSALAGVSRPTASKYFENADAVSPRSRQKIESTLKKVDYRPSLLASGLMRKGSRIIGVLIPSLGDPLYASIVYSIETYALKYGYMVMIECSYGDVELEANALDNFMSVKVSGICYAPSGLKALNAKLLRLQDELPIVFLDAFFDGAKHFVGNNNQQTIRTITEYMIGTGRKPMFFPMPDVNNNAKERLDVYINTMSDHDKTPMVLPVDTSETWAFEEWARTEALRMIRCQKLVGDAIICANDRVAFGVISALYSSGLLGQDEHNRPIISISGHDNQPLSKFTCPALTTIEQDVKGIGQSAIEIILGLLGVAPLVEDSQVRFNGTLVMRDSA